MPIIRIQDVAHVRFNAPNLASMREFLEDFGLSSFEHDGLLYGRGTDGAPFAHVTGQGKSAFVGLGLRAQSLDDLHTLAASEGVAVEDADAPGGGSVVRLRDPDGNRVEVVAGQAWNADQPPHDDLPFNSPATRRRMRAPIRLVPGPAHVHRLGHVVLNVSDFRRSEAWYKERFGFITSDEIQAGSGVAIGAFLRCDLGDRPTDHHTLFLAQLPGQSGMNHAAFEVAGFDDLMLGHAHLKARGRKQAWGVGRHKLGSQIFDYWKDPWGFELEHWTDGDLFTTEDGSNTASVRDLLDVQWGTPFPALAGKFAPSIETMSWVMALNIKIKRWLSRNKEKTV